MPKNDMLRVVEGGNKDDDSLFACSAIHVQFVIDRWKDGRKVEEFITAPIPVLASSEGDSAFGLNIDKIAAEVVSRVKSGDIPSKTNE